MPRPADAAHERAGGTALTIWLIQPGEPIPLWEPGHREWRTAQLAEALAGRGHEVVWWTSTYSHFDRSQWAGTDEVYDAARGYSVRFLRAPSYSRNVSVRRLANHAVLAFRWWRVSERDHRRPDVLVSSLPPVETNAAVAHRARRMGTPLVVDIRDLHPDAFRQAVPSRMRGAADAVLSPYRWANRYALRRSAAILAISPSYLAWGLDQAGLEQPRPKDVVIPFGYPRNPETDEARVQQSRAVLDQQGITPERKVVWFVGSLGESSDLGTAVEAFRLLSALPGTRQLQLVISGSGRAEQALRAAISDLDNVVLTGWLDAAGIAEMRRRAWVGLGAYRAGATMSLPNKVSEYLSGGLPIVHCLPGDTERVLAEADCGIAYAPGSARGLAAALTGLLEDEGRYDVMAANASELFAKEFDAEIVMGRMCDLVESAARSTHD